jgi:hypothetical protein
LWPKRLLLLPPFFVGWPRLLQTSHSRGNPSLQITQVFQDHHQLVQG